MRVQQLTDVTLHTLNLLTTNRLLLLLDHLHDECKHQRILPHMILGSFTLACLRVRRPLRRS